MLPLAMISAGEDVQLVNVVGGEFCEKGWPTWVEPWYEPSGCPGRSSGTNDPGCERQSNRFGTGGWPKKLWLNSSFKYFWETGKWKK